MTVGEYVRAAGLKPWNWGEHDCCTFMAGWVMERGNSDPMSFIRGSYDSELSGLRRVREGGGLIPLWDRGMSEAGVDEAEEFEAGDVGIIQAPTEEGLNECAAIYSGERWLFLTLQGIMATPAVPLKAWRP